MRRLFHQTGIILYTVYLKAGTLARTGFTLGNIGPLGFAAGLGERRAVGPNLVG